MSMLFKEPTNFDPKAATLRIHRKHHLYNLSNLALHLFLNYSFFVFLKSQPNIPDHLELSDCCLHCLSCCWAGGHHPSKTPFLNPFPLHALHFLSLPFPPVVIPIFIIIVVVVLPTLPVLGFRQDWGTSGCTQPSTYWGTFPHRS